jgi:ribose 5-phosphate isomerase B
MKIAISNDHGGINLKNALKKHLDGKGIAYVDYGYNVGGEPSPDYPDYVVPACEAIVNGECDLGILICGTGIGVSIVANKIPGIRCGHTHDTFSARMTRMHNHANVIAFGERVIGEGLMCDIVDAFLDAEPMDGRHLRRVEKITAIEKKYSK